MRLSQETKLRVIGFILIIGIFGNSYDTKPDPTVLGAYSGPAVSQPSPTVVSDVMAAISAEGPSRFIAHAGGLYKGKTYTNSIAALENSYQAGYRIQEVDLNLTTDGQIVLLHDWGPTVENVYGIAPGQRDLQTFLSETAAGVHRVAVPADLAAWMISHPAARIMLDTKADTVGLLTTIAAHYPELRSQFIPLIYSFSQYEPVKQLGFPDISMLVSTNQYSPQALVAFARSYPLYSISMQPATLIDQMAALSRYTRIYCWTINDASTQQRLVDHLAYGVVTDTLTPPEPAN